MVIALWYFNWFIFDSISDSVPTLSKNKEKADGVELKNHLKGLIIFKILPVPTKYSAEHTGQWKINKVHTTNIIRPKENLIFRKFKLFSTGTNRLIAFCILFLLTVIFITGMLKVLLKTNKLRLLKMTPMDQNSTVL